MSPRDQARQALAKPNVAANVVRGLCYDPNSKGGPHAEMDYAKQVRVHQGSQSSSDRRLRRVRSGRGHQTPREAEVNPASRASS